VLHNKVAFRGATNLLFKQFLKVPRIEYRHLLRRTESVKPFLVGASKNCVFRGAGWALQGKTHPFLTLFHGEGWVFRCALVIVQLESAKYQIRFLELPG
jgi:hypothetical protein